MSNTYSPAEVDIIIAGTPITAWDSVTITQESPTFRTVKGIRGKNTRVRVNNTSAVLEIEVDQTSDANALFTEILKKDIETGNGRIELIIKDGLNTDLFTSDQAYVSGPPVKTFRGETSTRTWRIECLKSTSTESNDGSPLMNLFSGVSGLFS